MNISPSHRSSHLGAFHFQPCQVRDEWNGNDSPPLLFTSKPPSNQGGVTLFFRTRKTLRRRLGVHDLGELDGVLKEKDAAEECCQMESALERATNWSYLFPDPKTQPPEEQAPAGQFHKVMARTISR